MDVSIVIPVKNGGERLRKVLHAIRMQKGNLSYEVICVDSGSTDGSVDIIRTFGCRMYEIAPEEFGHGKTRNLGASYGTGEFIVFLTQDAVPASDEWLLSLVQAMREDERIAGGFGKHLPYPDCNLPDQLMLKEHFLRFTAAENTPTDAGEAVYRTPMGNTVFQLTDEVRQLYNTDEGYRQFLAFFSDNCSCLRRSVWEEIPYDDVDYAEDQFWARKILEAGYKKVFCPTAAVYHSHNYPLRSYAKRYYDDFKAVYRVYGTRLCPDAKAYIRGVLGDTKHQCGFICRYPGLPWTDKWYWCFYALFRNFHRYTAAVRAVRYFSLPEEGQREMDRKYSQQYLQIRGRSYGN